MEIGQMGCKFCQELLLPTLPPSPPAITLNSVQSNMEKRGLRL